MFCLGLYYTLYYYLNTLCSYFLLSNVFFSFSSRCLKCLESPPLLCLLFPCFLSQPFFSYLICFYFQPTNYSFSPNFLDFLLIYINCLKFSDHFCFFTVPSSSVSAFKIGYSTLSTQTSLFLFPLLFAYLLLPTLFTYLSLHYGTYSTFFCLRLFPPVYLDSHTTLFTTHAL